MSTADFLVELGTEELPPVALPELQAAFAAGIARGLADASLTHAPVKSFAAPRRLAVLVPALPLQQSAQQIRRRGPPVNAAFDKAGQPTRAAQAFAESCGVALSALTRAQEGKGEFLFFEGTRAGVDTATLLPAIVQHSLDALPIPRRMRWGASEAQFVRPVHWLLMLHGADVVPARILDTDSGNTTRGHRFHAPAPLVIDAPASYAAVLRERGWVLVDFAERRTKIASQIEAEAQRLGGRAVSSDALLDEVTALVEWPVAVVGRFDERFLALPREVLISTLQEHQRYFPVEAPHGRLTPWFITISNIESRDPQRVREGNERVVRPRLSDAAFFYEQDRKAPLAQWRGRLDSVTFQAKLGSIGDKTRRIEALAAHIAEISGISVPPVIRCAQLAKCDLLSSMVGEFPDLQGVMGAYYAAADGEAAEVAAGIREHYLPRSAGDALPASEPGIAVALADRLDSLAGIFAIGQKPSGTKDPFALRRAAIGVLRILLEKRLDLDLRALVQQALAAQPVANPPAAGEVLDFILERLRAFHVDAAADGRRTSRAVSTEMFDAVIAVAPPRPLDIEARLDALADFLATPGAASLTAANKRIANILRKSEPAASAAPVDAAALQAPAERALHAAIGALRDDVSARLRTADYAGALERLGTLRPAIDGFFDEVMVNDPDPALRRNRLALVASVLTLFSGVADLSRLPGS